MRLVQPSEMPDPYEGDLPDPAALAQGRASREGAEFDALAISRLEEAGGTIVQRGGDYKGISIDALVKGKNGRVFTVLAHGNVDQDGKRPGLRRTDTVRKAGDSAFLLDQVCAPPLLLLTSDVPVAKGRSHQAALLLAMHATVIFDVIEVRSFADFMRLRRYLEDVGPPDGPWEAPWRLAPTQQLQLDVWRSLFSSRSRSA